MFVTINTVHGVCRHMQNYMVVCTHSICEPNIIICISSDIIILHVSTDPSASCINGAVRLSGGRDRFEGRAEICIGGEWGTICQDLFWNDVDARVICRQLGYENPQEALAVTAQEYGLATGPIFLNGLNCSGSESRITDCPTLNLGFLRFCTHSQDVGVICRGMVYSLDCKFCGNPRQIKLCL